ncbi:LLM class flavin-dependent oxidoreductase [Actinomycetospora sp. TBRC 11914]|uniref:LLM class flavin-dependent oxidoreductase n=1 Tax=Actinomycetospora sp. TBRC 11914 TaxID=2729387 RepID=UPI00145DC5F4|nr:LLM class flavin-dependent oxidoreductase [Actinomycetospora sp. TBRC 11914]NMO91658.1 LLM class flavin-dependent oxidoreductase [Actinomycetospora sp. TBRC 11914]
MRLGVTIPSRTGPMANVATMAARADAAGFDATWVYEVYRSPFTMLGTIALQTEQAALGTGLAAALPRSPFETANAAADIDEMSGGRMILGIGTGVPEFLRRFHSTDTSHPLGRMSEYIEVLRRSFDYLNTGDAEKFEGKHYTFDPLRMNPWGVRELPRPQIPIYLAAMGPKLLELCGRKADGWLGYFATPEFMTESVTPKIAAGAEKAGRDRSDVEVTVFNICCVHPDRDVAMARARRQVGFYVVHPVSDPVVALHGLTAQVDELRSRMRTEGLAAFEHTADELVETLSITGTPEEVRQKADRFRGVVDHLALHTPYVPPFTPEESEDAFDQIVAAFGNPTGAARSTAAAAVTVGAR